MDLEGHLEMALDLNVEEPPGAKECKDCSSQASTRQRERERVSLPSLHRGPADIVAVVQPHPFQTSDSRPIRGWFCVVLVTKLVGTYWSSKRK